MIKSYKGFSKNMTCRGFQYEIGKEYECETADVCTRGFHACEMPLECFQYYNPSESIYCEVEQDGELSTGNFSTKIASTKIKIGTMLDIAEMIKAQINFIFNKIKDTVNKTENDYNPASASGEKSSAITSGDYSVASVSGDYSSAATSGYCSSASTSGHGSSAVTNGEKSSASISGDYSSAATSGLCSSASTSGHGSSAATSGFCSTASVSGYCSSAVTIGDYSSATASGDYSSATTSGFCSTASVSGYCGSASVANKNSIAVACGENSKAKGVVGSYIVVTEWNFNHTEILSAKMIYIDGENYLADTWYCLKDGEIVEVPESEVEE